MKLCNNQSFQKGWIGKDVCIWINGAQTTTKNCNLVTRILLTALQAIWTRCSIHWEVFEARQMVSETVKVVNFNKGKSSTGLFDILHKEMST